MKLHRIYALKANVTQSPIAHLGARSYLQIDIDMNEEQRREAIFTLLGSMSEQDAYQWLKSEFPDWFPEDELLDALRRVMRHIPADAGGASLGDDMHRARAVIAKVEAA